MMYEIRRWNDHGRHSWELWRCTQTGRWPFTRYQSELVSKHGTEQEAQSAMIDIAECHYDSIEDYDKNGRRIRYGW